MDRISIQDRPDEVLSRALPGDWEGDFVKGAGNASAIGTLVERKSRYTLIVKMKDCGAEAALQGFTRISNRSVDFHQLLCTAERGKPKRCLTRW